MQKTRENDSATIKYAMSEVMQIQFFETQNYPFSACISDTGGAAGLFLGLNAIGNVFLKTTSKLDFLLICTSPFASA